MMEDAKLNNVTPPEPTKVSGLIHKGESARLRGEYATAVGYLANALNAPDVSDKLRVWVHAHLGASWVGMGNLKAAIDHLRTALEARPDYAWARGNKGEALRVYARDNATELLQKKLFWPCIAVALDDFAAASEEQSLSAWVYAHHGATWASAYWYARHVPAIDGGDPAGMVGDDVKIDASPERVRALIEMVKKPETLVAEAIRCLDMAIDLNPTYSWAQAFKGYLLTLSSRGAPQDYELALQQYGQAAVSSLDMGYLIKVAQFKLLNYAERYHESVQYGFQTLKFDSMNVFAPYFIAIGLSQIVDRKIAEGAADVGIWREIAESAIRMASRHIDTTQMLVHQMRLGLLIAQNDPDTAKQQQHLKEAVRLVDLESVTPFAHCPVFDKVRDEEWFQQTLRAASVKL